MSDKRWSPANTAQLLLCAVFFLLACESSSVLHTRSLSKDMNKPVYEQLTDIRKTRQKKVLEFMSLLRSQAIGIRDDVMMNDAFHKYQKAPDRLDKRMETDIEVRFISDYSYFYDILFVDSSGMVFHSVRMESDYKTNLFEGVLKESTLAQTVKASRKTTYMDFESYSPSREPAAFFIVPVRSKTKDSVVAGWFVLQVPTNHLNAIMIKWDRLGRTGETYLLNSKQQLITRSRFMPITSDFEFKVQTIPATLATNVDTGQRLAKDYRGVNVLSSYGGFSVLGSRWTILAEMDESEVITNFYLANKSNFLEKLKTSSIHASRNANPIELNDVIKVDVNEFARGENQQLLGTFGVHTCTAVAVLIPGGRAYLGHLSPTDTVYGHENLGYNNKLGEMLHDIVNFEIPPSQMRGLRFVVIATQFDSLEGTVDKILKHGVELTQISLQLNKNAQSADIILSPQTSKVYVRWDTGKGLANVGVCNEKPTIADLIKKLSRPAN